MSATPIPPQSSILVPDAVAAWLQEQYGWRLPPACCFYRHGLNDTYRVRLATDTYFLRVYRLGWRLPAEIEAEISFLDALHDAGVPVATAVADQHGQHVQDLAAAEGCRHAVLFTAAPGQLVKNPTPAQSRALGQLAARMHHVADGLDLHRRRLRLDAGYLIDRPVSYLHAVFGHLVDEMAFVTEVAQQLRAWLETECADCPDEGLCHGDLHAENAHFAADLSPTLFDFDCCGYGCRAYDLATFLWSRHLLAPSPFERERTIVAFLEGYEAARPLPQNALKRLFPFIVVRQLWVMGIHTGPATLHYGRRWLDEQYVEKHFGLLRRLAADYVR